MGLFIKKKNGESYENEQELNDSNDSQKKEEIKQDIDEWIWIDGYKGTDKEMKCRGTQYELNKSYIHDGKVELCESGFHLCKTLDDVFNYYSLGNGNRFFKVKALVRKKDSENYRSGAIYFKDAYGRIIGTNNNDKLVAREITFIDEIKYIELLKYIEDLYPLIKNEDDWNLLQSIGESEFYKKYFLNSMVDYGYSNTFALVLLTVINKQHGAIQINIQNTLIKAKAFKDEGVSIDMAVYLLLQN